MAFAKLDILRLCIVYDEIWLINEREVFCNKFIIRNAKEITLVSHLTT